MSWLDKVRNSIPFIPKRETPDNLWHKCPSCGTMLFTREYEENQSVCPKCQHHGRIGPDDRFDALFDGGLYTLLPDPEVAEDPLKFRDSKRYADRLKAARAKTGEADALVNARGTIEGYQAIVGVQNYGFLSGTMGLAVGEAFIVGVQAAIAQHCPYIIFTSGGGARMQEGIMSLMQMPKTTIGVQQLREAGLPYIVVMTDPTTGGITASYAMLGDVQLAEPGALIGFAGQRVIESTIREKLPEGFQRAEYLLEHGMLDMVVHRHKLRAELARLVSYLCPGKAAA
ncbi:acetyl-CoA carboxylase, carboxyltransferase subunit beta [Sphingomonas nostoxanthinifaciens]|uniref:acetyl-CoA carboxylase, carboxyltransferase subunit beta n=1 Tax=Sphingomonas nostoxanthinifaciens TaxID=2872652 RepID=UPI001CC1D424|nr:acetyl-CoA carboxylase, carboxyltransferase subunit beta [Sphingomonas nostoxanthinifaciens]UAK23903.1 acetyl-CoA carboxylase, carboxyltransferase subunit beta [Sphingomonas nostoxanthinifaciens]